MADSVQLQDPNFQEAVKKNITSAAETVQKTGIAGYQALGKQVSQHTGVQLPGATLGPATSMVSPPVGGRKEEDYEDFWAENGIKDGDSKNGMFVGQTATSSMTTAPRGASNAASAKGKDDEWENW
jgi:hypothetical protein